MKHIFVINGAAGNGKESESLKPLIAKLSCDAEIYETKAPRDAVAFVDGYCKAHSEPVRFYACGGDGTLKEVAEGAMGHSHASISVVPVGSGNDFVKYFGGAEGFLDVEDLVNAEAKDIDVIGISADGVEDTYSINVCNFGFDAYVATVMHKVRRTFLLGGKNAYTTGIVAAIFRAMRTQASIYADGKLISEDGAFTLCTVANGGYVGGGYNCAPRADVEDGFIEVCMIKPMSLITFLRLIGIYKTGGHLEDKRFAKYIKYCRAKEVVVEAKKPMCVCLDGEVFKTARFVATVKEKAIKFASPMGK